MNYLQYIPDIPLCIIIRQLGPANYNKFNTAYKRYDTDPNYPIDKYIEFLPHSSKDYLELILKEYVLIPNVPTILQILYGTEAELERHKEAQKNAAIKLDKLLASYPLTVLEEITKVGGEFVDMECYSKIFMPHKFAVYSKDISASNITRFKHLLFINLPKTKQINLINIYISHYYHIEIKEILHKYNISYNELSIHNRRIYHTFVHDDDANPNPRSITADTVKKYNIFTRLGKWLFGYS